MIIFQKKVWLIIGLLFSLSLSYGQKQPKNFPYKKGGLNKEEAAIHLLSRFTYGYNTKDIQDIQTEGLEKWFARQLAAKEKDKELSQMLEPYKDAMLDSRTLTKKYPRGPRVRRMMIKDGYIDKDSIDPASRHYRETRKKYMDDKGIRPEQEIRQKFLASKVLRATFSENQLQEIMTDFWFNHFNVSFTKPNCAPFIPSYENHVIRPNALGKFEKLLLSTAKSPAMLTYLDNVASVAARPNAKNNRGINENYARELMELHTLGVDGGYTQKDVSEAARILTGWTIYPMDGYGNQNIIDMDRPANKNNIIDGDFVFVANRHDKKEKIVMGKSFSNSGYEEGEELMNFLASRPQTAKFISRKLAVRFVSDEPNEQLVEKMAQAFLNSKGDIKEVLRTMVYSPEFWDKEIINNKVKTPFELAISSVRALDARVLNANRLNNWVTRMGEKKYYYIAPTGYPDRSTQWINTGSLLNRMNFGLSLTRDRNSGVEVDLLKLTGQREPESAEHALEVYAKILLPKTDVELLKKRLAPLMTAQGLQQKIEKSSGNNNKNMNMGTNDRQLASNQKPNNAMLAQVVGLIIGSPEFQKR